MSSTFPIGKIPADFIETLWRRHAYDRPDIVVGPGIGLDVAVLDMGDQYLVAKSDPITFAAEHIGWYAVHVNTNDIACSGADPDWFLATLLMPAEKADESAVRSVFDSIHEACEAVGAALVGGHSEVTHGITRPIVLGTMLGRVGKDKLVTSAGVQPGDAILVTGGLPLEGSAILAREFPQELETAFGAEFVFRCQRLLFDPGISVLPAARIARELSGVHAMHDPTEGGLATGLWELAQASALDLEIDPEQIPILPEGQILCDHFGLDPTRTLASGSLLISVDASDLASLVAAFAKEAIPVAHIGQAVEGSGQARLLHDSDPIELRPPDRDEIARLFD